MRADAESMSDKAHLSPIAVNLKKGIDSLSTAADWILATCDTNPQAAAAGQYLS